MCSAIGSVTETQLYEKERMSAVATNKTLSFVAKKRHEYDLISMLLK